MARLKLMVDRVLSDGRFVVINDSREDAPIGTIFVDMSVISSRVIEGAVESKQIGVTKSVALKLEAVESWRRALEAVPFGHNAAIVLTGAGLKELEAAVSSKAKEEHVFLATG